MFRLGRSSARETAAGLSRGTVEVYGSLERTVLPVKTSEYLLAIGNLPYFGVMVREGVVTGVVPAHQAIRHLAQLHRRVLP